MNQGKLQTKIKTLDELAELTREHKKQGHRVVHCHGVFDLLHIGHLRYFKQARELGDVLIVTLTPDSFVDKGPHRPAFNEDLRLEALASLEYVDYCAMNEWPTAEETLRKIQPTVYAKGGEFKNTEDDPTGKMSGEANTAKELGIELAFTEDIVFSSSNLINRFFSQLPEENQAYLKLFRKRYQLQSILDILQKMEDLKVLVVGDAIIDEYQYCKPLGKSSKDPILAVQAEFTDRFAGGSLAVANHLAALGCTVGLKTVLGKEKSHKEFILTKLAENVTPFFNTSAESPTLLKRRIIDGDSTNKLIEIYETPPSGSLEPSDGFVEWLSENICNYDLVVACDFGHGTITSDVLEVLCTKAPFLAVNTQANAGNRGFNVITKYQKFSLGTIAEHELRLERRNNLAPTRQLMEEIMEELDCETLIVTCGQKGCCVLDKVEGFVKVPALSSHSIDRVGAGDALLSVSALAAYLKCTPELLGFIGNVYGALAVATIGNEKAITRNSAQKFITSLMK